MDYVCIRSSGEGLRAVYGSGSREFLTFNAILSRECPRGVARGVSGEALLEREAEGCC